MADRDIRRTLGLDAAGYLSGDLRWRDDRGLRDARLRERVEDVADDRAVGATRVESGTRTMPLVNTYTKRFLRVHTRVGMTDRAASAVRQLLSLAAISRAVVP